MPATGPETSLTAFSIPCPSWHFYHLVYAPVQPFNLLHTLRSIALKFKWHALAKHFNQRSRHAAQLSGEKEKSGRGRGRGSGSAFPLAAMRSLSLPLEHLELLVSCTYNNIFLPSRCHCVSLCVCVCVCKGYACGRGICNKSNALEFSEKHKSNRAVPLLLLLLLVK